MSKSSKYNGQLRKISGSKNDLNSSKLNLNKNEITRCDILPSISPPTFVDDIFNVEKTSNFDKTSKKFRQWMNADSSSEAR